MHIGLLEDDAAIQEMLCLVLQDEGYAVTVYPTAEVCLKAFFTPHHDHEVSLSPIDLLIVDWRLSGSILGTEVIHKLRNSTSFDSLPIILTSAATFNNTNELNNLHVALLEKPFAIDDVVNMIHTLVQSDSTPTC
ncbi:MAG: hypothetical protein NVS4B7_12810 [Ktedonobacteraceae bacterium]